MNNRAAALFTLAFTIFGYYNIWYVSKFYYKREQLEKLKHLFDEHGFAMVTEPQVFMTNLLNIILETESGNPNTVVEKVVPPVPRKERKSNGIDRNN